MVQLQGHRSSSACESKARGRAALVGCMPRTGARTSLARILSTSTASQRFADDGRRQAMKDDLGDRMKVYEMAEAGRRLMPLLPVLARLDGRAFHSFTRDLQRPFDPVFSRMMLDTTLWLAERTGAVVACTQSDEMTLAW